MNADSTLPAPVQPAFFTGQRLEPRDLTAGQDYHREMRWLHARSLHAWGIALGLTATGDRGAKDVQVEPGYALDHLGRELVLTDALTVPVPPVAEDGDGGAVRYYLTVSYLQDHDARTVERRAGACAGEGAVRLAETPLVRWQEVTGSGGGEDGGGTEGGYRPGLDIVLASARVRHCRLDAPLSLVERRDARPATQPYVAGGATPNGSTPWSTWQENGTVRGLFTVVDTTSGRFASTPRYLAQLVGERVYPATKVLYEGWVHVHQPAPTEFTCRLYMPALALADGWKLNPPANLTNQAVLDTLSDQMRWHVAWLGVEG